MLFILLQRHKVATECEADYFHFRVLRVNNSHQMHLNV